MLKEIPFSHKVFGIVTTAALTACAVGEKMGFVTPTPEVTKINPTEVGPSNNFPIATTTAEVNSYGQYDFIEQSEIEANLREPYEHFKNNPDVKALFNDPGTIEYSAMGIKVYLQGGGHTNYIFFEASSETEEKGYIAMVFGGGQPGEISYSVLNRIVDSSGMVGLGLTSDIGGNQLENPVMIFNTGLTEKEISQLTADDLLKRDILFIPGGIKVPSERIIGAKALFSLLPVDPIPEISLPQDFLAQIPEGTYSYDANGLHITTDGGREFDIPTDKIAGKLQGETFVMELEQQSESGYQLGLVFRDSQWRETLINFPFETNGRKLNEFPTIFYDDIASDRLAEAERLASQPFPEGVEPLNNYYYDSNFNEIYPEFAPQTGYELSLHPEKFPMRFVYFYQAEINNIPVVVATLQVLNKDNTSVFIHMVESRKFINRYRDWWNENIQLRRVPSFGMALGGDKYDICRNGWSEAVTQVVCPLNAPKRDRLQTAMQKLIEEQRIPEEFEEVLFLLVSGRWY